MKRRKIMTNEQLKEFYYAVLKIAVYEREKRKRAKEMLRLLMAEMLRRGM